jgi:hypothetical protein
MTKRDAWSEKDVAFTVHYWELNAQERDDFQLLHSRMSDVNHWTNSPEVVVRYLKARPGQSARGRENVSGHGRLETTK